MFYETWEKICQLHWTMGWIFRITWYVSWLLVIPILVVLRTVLQYPLPLSIYLSIYFMSNLIASLYFQGHSYNYYQDQNVVIMILAVNQSVTAEDFSLGSKYCICNSWYNVPSVWDKYGMEYDTMCQVYGMNMGWNMIQFNFIIRTQEICG